MEKRLFIGIKINPEDKLIEAFDFFKEELSSSKIKWVDENNIHLTLKFLGETDIEQIPAIKQVLRDVAKKIKKVTFSVEGSGFFGTAKQPTVVWLGTKNYKPMAELAKQIDEELSKIGFSKDDRAFKPHITIGRVKFINYNTNIKDVIDNRKDEFFQDCRATHFTLYESILMPQGPIYTELEKYELSGN